MMIGSLVPDYESSEDTDNEGDVDSPSSTPDAQESPASFLTVASDKDSQVSPQDKKIFLPLPALKPVKVKGEQASLCDLQKRQFAHNSVYSNPFLQAEDQRLNALMRHGPLVDVSKLEKEKSMPKIRGNKFVNKARRCVHFFKRGSCKYGADCKFLHSTSDTTDGGVEPLGGAGSDLPSLVRENLQDNQQAASDDCPRQPNNSKRASRAARYDNLIPSKRALLSYKKLAKPFT